MRIAAFQFDVRRGELQANLDDALEGLRRAADLGVELVLLPEMWSTSFVPGGPDETCLAGAEAADERLRRVSEEVGVAVAGSAFERNHGGRPFNTMRLFDRGELALAYRKVHLFSPTAENQAFEGGATLPGVIEWRGWKLAAGICYDLRFPGLWRRAFAEQAELVLVCAQWPVVRARHWKVLLRGRAVEQQAFFLGSNRTGTDFLGRRKNPLEFPGNSLLISPHGDLLAQGRGQTGLVIGELDRDEMQSLRRTLPVHRDERLGPMDLNSG